MTNLKLPFLLLVLLSAINLMGQKKTFYDFSATTIEGKQFNFTGLKGKKVLVVNIATRCSLAPQLKKLQQLYEEYGGDDFEIIAFPCNDYGNQEPGDNAEIDSVCTKKYRITFPVMEKIQIKGENCNPIYKWLTSSEENGTLQSKVTWNYQKFLIDEEGKVVDSLSPVSSPKSNRIMEWLLE